MKENNFISAVIYIHNDAQIIKSFLLSINDVLKDNFNKYEIICIDDASDDNSVSVIKQSVGKITGAAMSILHMGYYHGIESSMNAGLDLAVGDFVFEFDRSVLDFPLENIMQVYYHSLTGYDIVSAAPKPIRRADSLLFYFIFNHYSNTRYKLKTERFRILSRRAINRIQSINSRIPYRKAVYANCGLKLDTIYYSPVVVQSCIDRKEADIRKGMAVDSLILFTNLAYRATFYIAIFMMLMMIGVAGYTFYIFLNEGPVEGWTTTMLFLSGAFFGVFTILAIVIKYLSVLIALVFKRQSYIVESIEKVI